MIQLTEEVVQTTTSEEVVNATTEEIIVAVVNEDVVTISSVEERVIATVSEGETIGVVTTEEVVLPVEIGTPGPMGPMGLPGPPGSGSNGPVGLAMLDTRTTLNLGAGNSVDLDSTPVAAGAIGYLLAVSYASTVSCKWQIYTVENGIPVLKVTRITNGYFGIPDGMWATPGHGYIFVGATNLFRVTVTNLDDSRSADAYVEMYWDEVA